MYGHRKIRSTGLKSPFSVSLDFFPDRSWPRVPIWNRKGGAWVWKPSPIKLLLTPAFKVFMLDKIYRSFVLNLTLSTMYNFQEPHGFSPQKCTDMNFHFLKPASDLSSGLKESDLGTLWDFEGDLYWVVCFKILACPETTRTTMAEIGALIRKQQSKFVETLAKKSHFSMSEVDGLLSVYRKLSEGLEVDRMDRTRFREFLHNAFDMTDDILLDRIFKRFDADNDGYVSREEWVYGLSVFLKGNEDQHIEYCFDIYDLNSDGFISREEMLNMLKTCLGRQGLEEDQDEGDLIEMTLRKMDIDKDGRISESDWTQTIKAEPLMLEAFGPCLPQRNAGEIFLEKCREAD
ncbi:hypothetical protein TCAL_03756 [Tigriopus californicus]|uniref:EF-hand domain-containing protein n=1 Tax=Tigriopus californicus TaxID=6832 RepID=A0A553NQ13_TIGCA|nr:hypothetical protein TCAL_03756 [Tigriopus californicus]